MPLLDRVRWGSGRKTEFKRWFHDQLSETIGDRQELERNWEDYIKNWRAKFPEGERSFPWPGAPLARDTEILTRTGWTRIDSVRPGEYVLTRNDDTSQLEWNPVQATPSVWAPELLHFESQTVDFLTTPGHTMIVENQRGEVKRPQAEELWGKTGYFIPLVGEYEGTDQDEIFGHDAGDVAEFVGWYLTEGSTTNSGSIRIAQRKKRGRRIIKSLLRRLDFTFTADDSGFTVFARTVPDSLIDWLDGESWCHEKQIPKFFYGASPRIIKRLLYGLIGGDGRIRMPRDHQNLCETSFYTTSPDLADDVQALSQLAGFRASVSQRDRHNKGGTVGNGRTIKATRTGYTVRLLQSKRAKLNKPHYKERVEYNDFAFCVTVDNHAIYVRRNGKAGWTANSNLEFPLTAMHTDPVYSDFMTTLHAPEDYWHVTPRRAQFVGSDNAIRETMTALEADFVDMRGINQRALLDLVVLGTSIYKVHWDDRRKKVREYNEQGEIEQRVQTVSEPLVEHVPLWHFYVPATARSIDPDANVGGAQWAAEKFFLRESELHARADEDGQQLPAYDKRAADFVAEFTVDTRVPDDEEIDKLIEEEEDFEPFTDPEIELFEVWARFDVDGDGIDEDVVLIWHQQTSTILRALHLPFMHGKRPYVVTRYLQGFGFYGLGIGEIDEWAQATTTKLLNATIDNVTLANTRMFSAPIGSNISPGEPVYPGKIWMIEDDEQIGSIQLGEVYPSIFQLLGQTQQWAEQRTGVNELVQGNIQNLPDRTPAATTISALQESNQRFDMILGNLRHEHGKIGMRIFQMLAQYFREDPVRWRRYLQNTLGQEEAQIVAAVLQQPIQDIENGVGMLLGATSSQANKQADKQQFITLLQTVSQIYPQLIQTAQLAESSPPDSQTSQTAAAAFAGGIELLTRLLERFEIENPRQFLPDQAAAAQMQAGQQQFQGQFGPLGGLQGAAPFAQAPNQIAQLLGLGR